MRDGVDREALKKKLRIAMDQIIAGEQVTDPNIVVFKCTQKDVKS